MGDGVNITHKWHLSIKMISNKNSLNYQVVDLDESYNFHIKFIFIQVYIKIIMIF
jgi:hypothetical protein